MEVYSFLNNHKLDTDSIMIKQKYKNKDVDLQTVIKDSKMMVAEVTKYLQGILKSTVLKMGWEKIYWPMLLCGKKKYAGLKFEDEKEPKIDVKGLDTVRRETTKMTKNLVEQMFKLIFIKKDVEAAINLAKQTISDLLQQKISISQLISSKKLKSLEMYKTPQIHTILNEKIKKRGGNEYRAGDRVLFVVISGEKFKTKTLTVSKLTPKSKNVTPKINFTSKESKVSDRGEDPLYAADNNLKIDIDYYFENQIEKPLRRIFSHVIKNIDSLFKGEHTRKKVLITPDIFPLKGFVTEVPRCLCCEEKLKTSPKKNVDMEDMLKYDSGPLCNDCKSKGLLKKKHDELIKNKEDISIEQNKCFEECYKCQGSRNEIICSNFNACDTFWIKRDNIKKEKKLDKLLIKFNE